jgi:hypothetical protein
MHIQHIESTSGHTGNISGPLLTQSKVDIGTLMWTLIHLKDTNIFWAGELTKQSANFK